jgi:uncharacterized LabA/DUF88 family protein
MVFMDYMNFEIALQGYYNTLNERTPKLDYNKIFKAIAESRGADFLKTFIFAPEPDQFLIDDEGIKNSYKWLKGMANAKYLDIIFGRHIARPTNADIPMDINKRETYYKVEKGTDLNLAIHAVSKAHYNSYDVAFVMSADTDYISLYRHLKMIGKIVIPVIVKGQYLGKVIPEVDEYLELDKDFFSKYLRNNTFQNNTLQNN